MIPMEFLVREWQERPLPVFARRDLKIDLQGHLATAIIGMRRSGKTWRLFQEMEKLAGEGVNPAHILYFNFDDERLGSGTKGMDGGAGPELLDDLLETFFRLNPSARREGAYLFFDEIQEIPGWARFARRIIDTEKVKLYLSGSSSRMLSTEIATEFRGRSLAFELLPFSFREFLRFRQISEKPAIRDRSLYEQAFTDYLTVGGFPEVLAQNDTFVRTSLLQSYLDVVVLRDVLERHSLSNARGVRELAHTLVTQNGNLVSIKRLTDQLTARNISMSKEMTGQVCGHLEDAFLVFFMPIYTQSLQKMRVNPQKVYASDPALAFAVQPAGAANLGQRFEQAVYLELRRRFPLMRQGGISYYLTQDRREVDFILGDPARQIPQALFQVCVSLKDAQTREREIEALQKAMEELELKEALVLTLYEREELKTAAGLIRVQPAWEWFLEEPTKFPPLD
ncbi:ATPase [Spirochaetia bacterium]|nr:ATPase [Spirochaetia bacterium]